MTKVKSRHEQQETYWRASDDTKYHRCLLCWYRGPNKDVANGYTSAEKPYKHADSCPNQGRF